MDARGPWTNFFEMCHLLISRSIGMYEYMNNTTTASEGTRTLIILKE